MGRPPGNRSFVRPVFICQVCQICGHLVLSDPSNSLHRHCNRDWHCRKGADGRSARSKPAGIFPEAVVNENPQNVLEPSAQYTTYIERPIGLIQNIARIVRSVADHWDRSEVACVEKLIGFITGAGDFRPVFMGPAIRREAHRIVTC